ncbi:metalloproteinase inhibitor 1-like [Ambystoma mexicanum]|uniref:metalloproteinase inhibitor 1-like n=1 Tax=Ambystoma mexicanum TaxID=8296 RepID=UPI0037E7BD6F
MGASSLLCFAVILLSLAANCPSEGCSCFEKHLQTAFCKSDVVVKVKFLSAPTRDRVTSTIEDYRWIRFGIKTLQVFKGGEGKQNLKFLYTSASSTCRYFHDSTGYTSEYLVAGHRSDGRVEVTQCSFIKPWAELTRCQIQGILGLYSKGCNCNIIPCYYQSCSETTHNGCVWTEYDTLATTQAQNQTCVKKDNGKCTWQAIPI